MSEAELSGSRRGRPALAIAILVVLGLLASLGIWWALQPKAGRAEAGWIVHGGYLFSGDSDFRRPGELEPYFTTVAMPGRELEVTISGPQQSLSGQAPDDGIAPPRGGRFIGVRAETSTITEPLSFQSAPYPLMSFTLVVDGRDYPIPDLAPDRTGGATLVWVAVATEAKSVDLRIGYAGRQATVHTDGAEPDLAWLPAALPEQAYRGSEVADYRITRGVRADDEPQLRITGLAASPHVAGLGWAPNGTVWRVASLSVGGPSSITRAGESYRNDGDATLSVTATLPGLRELPSTEFSYPVDRVFAIPLPPESSGTITITWRADYEGQQVAVSWDLDVAQWIG